MVSRSTNADLVDVRGTSKGFSASGESFASSKKRRPLLNYLQFYLLLVEGVHQ